MADHVWYGISPTEPLARCGVCGSAVPVGKAQADHEANHGEWDALVSLAAELGETVKAMLTIVGAGPLTPGETRDTPGGNSVHRHVAHGMCPCGAEMFDGPPPPRQDGGGPVREGTTP